MFSGMDFREETLFLIDQRLLPGEEKWLSCRDLESVALAIEEMAIRGAPAIGCAAAFALALDVKDAMPLGSWASYSERFNSGINRLARTRPTAVNLFHVLDEMKKLALSFLPDESLAKVSQAVERLAISLYAEDLETCKAIGRHGSSLVPTGQKVNILTHCNTGSLATAGYGTALGVIRALAEKGQVSMVYADETRPWLQGARLTAFELRSEGIPYKVIADSAAAYLMQLGRVDFVIVGADRIALNGDTANKIGTYNLAVQCRHHGIPFYVAAPLSTFDFSMDSGANIAIEERSPAELRSLGGRALTPSDAPVWNPSFDVTPGELISGIITEKGVLRPPYTNTIRSLKVP